MRRSGAWACLFLVAVLVFVMAAQAEEILIDIVDGELRVQNYRIGLAEDEETPVTLDSADGDVILRVITTQGEVELNLGQGVVGLTERAYPYVTLVAQPTATAPATTRPETECRHCGASLKNHSCPRCNKRYCVHDDIACGYRLNPAPTPFSTTDADGKTVTQYLAPDGSYYAGPPIGQPTHKYAVWSPGYIYMETRATPTPTATWPWNTPTPSPIPTPTSWPPPVAKPVP